MASSSSSSSSSSPCAACKFLRRKCTQGCVFAPYFPPDQPTKFTNVHRVFGASNVAKLLNDLPAAHREDAVNSLAYEAEARLRDPVYGCVGYISLLQQRLKQLQLDLYNAKKELTAYIGGPLPAAFPYHPGGQGQFPPQYLPGVGRNADPQLLLQDQLQQQQQLQLQLHLQQQQRELEGCVSDYDVIGGSGGGGRMEMLVTPQGMENNVAQSQLVPQVELPLRELECEEAVPERREGSYEQGRSGGGGGGTVFGSSS